MNTPNQQSPLHKFTVAGIFFALTAVILGAFGAHALKATLSTAHLQSFETGVRYQFYHAFILIILPFLENRIQLKTLKYSGTLFITGLLLFSGSIYLLSTNEISGLNINRILGPITPIGGLLLICGWAILLWGSIINQSNSKNNE